MIHVSSNITNDKLAECYSIVINQIGYGDIFQLIGYKLIYQGPDPYNEIVPIAMSDSVDELKIYADLQGLPAKIGIMFS